MGLFKKAGTSAAVMGTAKVVVGAVSKRLAQRQQEKAGAQAGGQSPPPAAAAPGSAAAPPAPAPPRQPPADLSLGGQLQQLATLRDQGVLSEDEFAAAKARLLGT
jgi:hypothetical protein